MEQKTILSVKNIVKRFQSVPVLNDVSFDIRQGEVLGIIGENGAGKSTLIKILCGIYQPTGGSIEVDGHPVAVKDPMTAKKMGIGLVPQEFNLINTLTVCENIYLGNEFVRNGALLDKKAMKKHAKEYLDMLDTKVGVDELVENLSVAGKQMVEISKALVHRARVLIMDEPTTALTGYEVETLFKLVAELKSKGVTVVFVSHKLHEIKAICDRVVVLRDGNLISVDDCTEVNEEDMARKMVGRDFSQVFPVKSATRQAPVVLRVKDLRLKGQQKSLGFELREGEILGFAGLVGSGRTELAEAVMGLRAVDNAVISIQDREVRIKSPRDAVRNKLGYISEDRQGKGIVGLFDIPQNLTLISLKKYAPFFIDKRRENKATQEYVKSFNIAAASLKMPLRHFSGGNQQKVYLARWMDTEPRILIFDEPTRGIDVNAKTEIYRFIHALSQRGISCIVISSELEEVIGLCSRVYVMREGDIVACLENEGITEEEIMLYATGLKKGPGVVAEQTSPPNQQREAL